MIISAALLSPIFISLFWLIILVVQEQHWTQKSKKYLAVFMINAFCLYSSHAVFFNHQYILYSYVESVYLVAMLSAYPLFYTYLLILANQKINWKKRFLHFIPALIFSVFSCSLTLYMNETERILYVQDTLIAQNLKGLIFSSPQGVKGGILLLGRLTFFIQVFVYAYLGIRLINSHNTRISNYYSNVEGKTLKWAKQMHFAILGVAVSSAIFTLIGRSFFSKHELSLLIPSIIFSTILFIIGLKGSEQVQVKEEFVEIEETEKEFVEIKISQEGMLKTQLLSLFDKECIFKQPDLRITTISEKLNTNRTYISRLINEEFNMNFNEFVNKYRINEAKILLANNDHKQYTMDFVAEKSGFGSIASFSRVFKDIEGLTPGKFRENQLNGNS